jgi:tRNA (guanine37-N1)-methyltransferase
VKEAINNMAAQSSSPLPPLSTLPSSIYPPSAYPSPEYFESTSLFYPALLIPARRTNEIQTKLKGLVFKEAKRKSVYPLEEGLDYTVEEVSNGYDPRKERKLVLTRHGPADTCSRESEVEAAQHDKVFQDPILKSLIGSSSDDASPTKIRPSYIRLTTSPYSLLSVDQVLRRIMPCVNDAGDEINNDSNNTLVEEIPSSFEVAGHVAHVNLREESLPYKYLIGKAILDKNKPKIKVVVNKIGNIENEFRTFPMEILAGEGLDIDLIEKMCATNNKGSDANQIQVKVEDPKHHSLMEVEVKEHGCRFQLDFAKVYWNSRLSGEHEFLVKQIVNCANEELTETKEKKCIVADVMGGVGPFAVPLTSSNTSHYHKTPILCHANDLNPVSYHYLQANAKLNRCFSDRLITYNMDGRAFIHKMNEDGVDASHFIMNLPAAAPEFLDAFRGWNFGGSVSSPKKIPTIHVHCFGEKARGPEESGRVQTQVLQRCEKALGCPGSLSEPEGRQRNKAQVRIVRDVGPRKNMFCVSFSLPVEVQHVEKLALDINDKRERDSADDAPSPKKRVRES